MIIRCQWRVPRKESRTLRVRRIIKPDNRTGWGGFAALPSSGVEIQLPCIVIKRRSACGLRGAFKKCHNYTVTAVRCQWSPRTDISLLLLVCPSCILPVLLSPSLFVVFLFLSLPLSLSPVSPAVPPAQGCNCTARHSDTWASDRAIDLTLRARTFERPFPRRS